MRPRLLDLFCCAGGAGMGYYEAGFDVHGVDIHPQPNYPFSFSQADALEYLAEHGHEFDAIHASPPCQRFVQTGMYDRSKHPDLLTPLRPLLAQAGQPWVIENVPGAPMRVDVMLCGSMFGMPIRRHRWFEFWRPTTVLTPPCDHSIRAIGVYGHPRGANARWGRGTAADWPAAMRIDWMTTKELSQAIPPDYTRFLGLDIIAALRAQKEVA